MNFEIDEYVRRELIKSAELLEIVGGALLTKDFDQRMHAYHTAVEVGVPFWSDYRKVVEITDLIIIGRIDW